MLQWTPGSTHTRLAAYRAQGTQDGQLPAIQQDPNTGAKHTSTRLIWGPAWKSAETLPVHQGSQHGHTDHAPHRPRLPGATAGQGAWLPGTLCAPLRAPAGAHPLALLAADAHTWARPGSWDGLSGPLPPVKCPGLGRERQGRA